MKFALYGFLGVFAIALAGLSVAVSFLDWNKYRATLSELATDQLGMQVELAGNISVALLPRPSVSAEMVRLSPIGEGYADPVATADKISLRLGFAGMVAGKASIQSLVLEGLTVALEQDAAQNWKLKGWVGNESEGGDPVEVSRLEIVNATVGLTPLGAAPRFVENLTMKLGGSLPSGPFEWAGGFEYQGEKILTEGRVKPVESRDEISLKASVSLASTVFDVSGRYASKGDMIGRVQASGESAAVFLPSVSRLLGTESPGMVPDVPFGVDIQMEKRGAITKLETKGFSIGSSRGRIDLTAVERDDHLHLTGAVALGVIDLEEWHPLDEGRAQPEPDVPDSAILSENEDSPSAVRGALDITIEGVKTARGIGQRIDLTLGLMPEGPSVSHLQALLPGATTLAVDGNLGTTSGKGRVSLDIGNLPDLLDWAGGSLPEGLQQGRLTTAAVLGELEYGPDVWILHEITGQVDTTEITGEASGSLVTFMPSHLKMHLSKLNLETFMASGASAQPQIAGSSTPPPTVERDMKLPELDDLEVDIGIDSLIGFDARLQDVRFIGGFRSGALEIDQLTARHGKGALKLEGRVENRPDASGKSDLGGRVTAHVEGWNMPVARYYIPDLDRHLIALGTREVDGSVSLDGTRQNMRVNVELASGRNELLFGGALGLAAEELAFVELQGSVQHEDIASFLRSSDWGDFNTVPLQLTLAAEQKDSRQPLEVKIAGLMAGGKLQADLSSKDSDIAAGLSYVHEDIPDLENGLGMPLPLLDRKEPLSLRLIYQQGTTGRQIELQELRSGAGLVRGNAKLGNQKQITGAFAVSGFDVAAGSSSKAEEEVVLAPVLDGLSAYRGAVNLDLKNITLAGQKFDAANGFIESDGQMLSFNTGSDARLNNAPMTAQLTIGLNGAYPLTASAKANRLSLAPLLGSSGISAVISADTSVEMTVEGSLAGSSAEYLKSMSGTGSLAGTAGRLAFLDVLGLQRSMTNAASGKGFLQTVGRLLRSGNTPISDFSGRFSLVEGVLLLEEAIAAGNWGRFAVDGQVNLPDRLLNLKGKLSLSTPADVPEIPVSYNGTFDTPNTQWSSRLFERFVIAGIERRLRAKLFGEMEAREQTSGEEPKNTGNAVFSRALGLLEQLRAAQQKKKEQQEKEKEAANGPAS